MGTKYLPLAIADQVVEKEPEYVLDYFKGEELIPEGTDTRQLVDFVISRDFCDPSYGGDFQRLNGYLLSGGLKGLLASIYPPGSMERHGFSPLTEGRDIFSMLFTVRLWMENKKVYKVDGDLFSELRKTQDTSVVPAQVFQRLPFETLYLDLESCRNTGNIAGAFIHANGEGESTDLAIYMVTRNAELFSYYRNYYGSSGLIDVKIDPIQTDDIVLHIDQNGQDMHSTIREASGEDGREAALSGILQTLIFLSSPSSDLDVSENEVTKKTYRPLKESSKIRNKFSEVQAFDVGIRYGKAIRLAKDNAAEAVRRESRGYPSKERKPRRPHVRCAHWQRYHVGPGRKEVRVNWIPPVYVGGGKNIAVSITPIETGTVGRKDGDEKDVATPEIARDRVRIKKGFEI